MEALCALIVDDSSVMRRMMERALRQAGIPLAEVVEAGNGCQALDIVRHHTVDLVLSDVNMPVMDGLEFVRQLRAMNEGRAVPVLMIPSEGSESRVPEAIACGAQGCVRKPFTADQVKRGVLALLGHPA